MKIHRLLMYIILIFLKSYSNENSPSYLDQDTLIGFNLAMVGGENLSELEISVYFFEHIITIKANSYNYKFIKRRNTDSIMYSLIDKITYFKDNKVDEPVLDGYSYTFIYKNYSNKTSSSIIVSDPLQMHISANEIISQFLSIVDNVLIQFDNSISLSGVYLNKICSNKK